MLLIWGFSVPASSFPACLCDETSSDVAGGRVGRRRAARGQWREARHPGATSGWVFLEGLQAPAGIATCLAPNCLLGRVVGRSAFQVPQPGCLSGRCQGGCPQTSVSAVGAARAHTHTQPGPLAQERAAQGGGGLPPAQGWWWPPGWRQWEAGEQLAGVILVCGSHVSFKKFSVLVWWFGWF